MRLIPKPSSRQGFTLIEILIALFVFTIVSLLTTSALHQLIGSQTALQKNAEQFAQLQVALLLFSRDVEQIIDRPLRTPAGNNDALTASSTHFTFTHTGLSNPNGQLRRPTLQRAGYLFSNQQWVRLTWPLPDSPPNTQPDKRILLEGVRALSFSYLDQSGHFHHRWPSIGQDNERLPRAIRITLTLDGWGTLQKIYLLRGQSIHYGH